MTKAFLPLLLVLATIFETKAQSILVLDKDTHVPIEHVLVFDELGNQAITSKRGEATLTELNGSIITLQHIGYSTKTIAKSKLARHVLLQPSSISVKEVVVSANKWEEDISEISTTVAKICREEIAMQNVQTAADILDQSGEVFVQKSQLGGGSPMIRGFAANKVLISIDGVRMNNAIYRSGNLQNVIAIDGLTTESAEVVFGPGSVIYGSDALGGVMDFHTISPQLNKTSGEAFTRFSSANLEKTGHVKFNIGKDKFAFVGAFTYSNFDDLISGTRHKGAYPTFGTRPEYVDRINGKDSIVQNSNINKQVYSGYSQLNGLATFTYKLNQFRSISYSFHFTNSSNIPRYDRLTEYKNDTLKYAQWYYGPQKWMMHRLQVKSSKEISIASEAKFTAALQTLEESRHDRKLNSSDLRHRTENVLMLNVNYDVFKELLKNTIYYGAEIVYNEVTSFANIENINTASFMPSATRYPSGGSTWASVAAYANLKHYFSSSLILNAGIRYSHLMLNSSFTDKSFYNFPYDEININTGATNGSVGIVWKISNEFNLKSSVSSGFRAPNVDDIGKVFDSEPGNVVMPNENLLPEYSYSGELTASGRINSFTYNVTGYYTRLQNAMVRRDFTFNGQDSIIYDGELSKVQALVNAGQAYIGGVSAKIEYTRNRFIFTSTLTYTTGLDVSNNEPLRHTAPLFGQTTITYRHNALSIVLTQRYNGSKTIDQLAPSELNKPHIYSPDGSPAWTTTSIKGQYKINKIITLNGGVENIFDVHYRPYSSGISAPGRNFILSLKASF